MCNPFGLATLTVRRSGPFAVIPRKPPVVCPRRFPSLTLRSGALVVAGQQVPDLVAGLARPELLDELVVLHPLDDALQRPQVRPRLVLRRDEQDKDVGRLAVDGVERDGARLLGQPDR